ncbi:glycosyltransferase family 39 protein [Streptomyces sp. NPDC058964]|uniref:glycosyltransferase family 39 protein n=1 Tax=Streptomyces sp. NPDC058964 TaxID=3346681 RepID=UPI0036B75D99
MSTSSVPRSGPAAQDGPGRRPAIRRLRLDAPRGVPAALVLFVAIRLTGVAVMAATNHLAHRPLLSSLAHSWDSVWYLHIAEHGYGSLVRVARSGALQTDWAFFPLYPGLIRGLITVLPLTPGAAGLVISWTAAVVAAWGIYATGRHLYGHGVATTLVCLWAALPHSVVLGLAYTEPVFSALAAWSLYCLLKDRWLWAGALAALAGLSRPSGFAVAVAVIAAWAHELIGRRGRVRPVVWVGAAVSPLGWLGYVWWVGQRTGEPWRGYFHVQDAWNSRFDFGAGSLLFLKALLLHGGRVVYPTALAIIAVGVLLFCLLCLDRAPLPLVVFAGALVALVLGASGSFSSKPRFLVPAFPLLIPWARALVRTWRARPAQALLVGGALTAVSLLYGAYLTCVAHSPL